MLGTKWVDQFDWHEGICWKHAFIKDVLVAQCFTCVIQSLNTHIKKTWAGTIIVSPLEEINGAEKTWWFKH